MLLSNEKNTFEMIILDYEFPNSKDRNDANWLKVQIAVSQNDNYWEAIDACLRTYELIELRNWFESISLGKIEEGNLIFTEYELSFAFKNQDKLLVLLNFAFHPKGSHYDFDCDKECVLHFELKDIDFKNILDFLTNVIHSFPEKVFV